MAEFEHLEELVVGLYDRDFLRFGELDEFPLNSGRYSPVYFKADGLASFRSGLKIHGRKVPVEKQQRTLKLAVEATCAALDNDKQPYEHLFGMPESCTAFGILIAWERGESYIWKRVNTKKAHGINKAIAGDYNPGDRTRNLDNALSTGGVFLKTVKELDEERELISIGLLTMLDREEGGRQALYSAGYDVMAIFGLSEAINILKAERRIGAKEIDTVKQYHDNLYAKGEVTTFKG